MFRRDNLIGFLLLGWCLVSAVILIRSILGVRIPTERVPDWVTWVAVAVFVFGMIWLALQSGPIQRRWGKGPDR